MRNPSKYRRYNIEGHGHELTFSCYRRQPFLKSERARIVLAGSINAAREKHNFDVWAYVFMPEHLHILLFPKNEIYCISDILKSIKQPVARRMITLLKKSNPEALKYLETGLSRPRYRFWQDGGGYDRNYYLPERIRAQVEYIHNNPVRRGLVDRAEEWKWSSAREWMEEGSGPLRIDRETFPSI